jgi:hypothetical protein
MLNASCLFYFAFRKRPTEVVGALFPAMQGNLPPPTCVNLKPNPIYDAEEEAQFTH